MTTYAIVISNGLGSTNITANTRRATWDRTIDESASTLDLECIGITSDYTMDTITLTVDGVLRFTGVVKEQSTGGDENILFTKLRCIDSTDRLQRKIVSKVYSDKTAKEIILDLVSSYATWINTSQVDDIGARIETITFNYVTFATALQNIADTVGAYWFLDSNNKLHFFQDYDEITTKSFSSGSNILKNSFDLKTSAKQLANRVWVIGAKTSAPNYINQYFTGDASNDIFSLAYIPNYPDVYENGVTKTIEVDKGEPYSTDYVYQKKEKVLKRVGGNLPNGVQLRIRYRPTVQIIDYFENQASINTYGLYEKVLRDKKITDKAAARQRGRTELSRLKGLIRYASFSSRDWDVAAGQVVNVNVPQFGYVTTSRILRVSIDFEQGDIIAHIETQEVVV
jgi:hypothetical protein